MSKVAAEDTITSSAMLFAAMNRGTALAFLDMVIQKLPDEERSSYQKAKQLCPELIEKESNPNVYLAFDQYNVWICAKRLASYWRLREASFGARAFRRLNLSPDGIFTKEEIEVIKSGDIGWTFLPLTEQGEVVLYFDRDSRSAEKNPIILESKAKFTFFFFATVGLQKEAQKTGFRIMYHGSRAGADVPGEAVKRLKAICDSLPVKLNCSLVAVQPDIDKAERKFLLETSLPLGVTRTRPIFGDISTIYSDPTKKELVGSLRKDGLRKEGIPSRYGGDFDISNVSSPKLLLEASSIHHIYSSASEKQFESSTSVSEADSEPNKLVARLEESQNAYKLAYLGGEERELNEEEEEIQRRRAKDVIYSRRKRQRQKERHRNLYDSAKKLSDENEKLRTEERRLQNLCIQATSIVNSISAGGMIVPTSLGQNLGGTDLLALLQSQQPSFAPNLSGGLPLLLQPNFSQSLQPQDLLQLYQQQDNQSQQRWL